MSNTPSTATTESIEDEKRRRSDELKRNLKLTFTVLTWWLGFSLLIIALYAIKGPKEFCIYRWVSISMNGWGLAAASLSFGVILGFLFGIPRTLQRDGANDPENGPNYGQRVNTNLEQISDWLTKIIVGVGLTQIEKVPAKLDGLAAYYGPSVGDNGAFALVIIINFTVTGFVMGYLLTRLFLATAFFTADSATLSAFQHLEKEVRSQAAQSSATQDTVKAMAYTVMKNILDDPLAADRRSDPATKQIIDAAAQKVMAESESKRSTDDWIIAAYQAFQTGKYEEAIDRAQNALLANPPKETQWRIYNLLGLSHHYLQPEDWEDGQQAEWFDLARKYYQLALECTNSQNETLLTKANLAYLYLDAGRLDDGELLIKEALAFADGSPELPVFDLIRLVAGAIKAMQEKPAEAAEFVNSVKDIARWKYLFEGKDLSKEVVAKLAANDTIKQEYRDFMKSFLG